MKKNHHQQPSLLVPTHTHTHAERGRERERERVNHDESIRQIFQINANPKFPD
jgi:hypothetical protein